MMNAGKFDLLYSISQRTLSSQFLCQIDPILLRKKTQHNFKRIYIDFEKKPSPSSWRLSGVTFQYSPSCWMNFYIVHNGVRE